MIDNDTMQLVARHLAAEDTLTVLVWADASKHVDLDRFERQ